jgi:hypothetical protein
MAFTMKIGSFTAATTLLAVLCCVPPPLPAQASAAATQPATAAPGLLTREQAGAVMPATVFFRGQSASTQARNSAGLRLPGGKLILAALVDTSGYSSAVRESYQAYLLTEVPLHIGGKELAPGAYGFGFVASGSGSSDKFVALDIGGNVLFTVPTTRDTALTRPNPLQLVRDTAPGSFRLYAGRSFVTLMPAVSP